MRGRRSLEEMPDDAGPGHLIAAVAWRHGGTVLAFDVDLDRVTGVIGVAMDPASLRA